MLLPIKQLFSLVAVLLSFATTNLAASLPYSTSIYSWPLTSDAPTLLAEISYDPKTLSTSLESYDPPKTTSSQTDNDKILVRIGLYNKATKEWTGTLTSLSSLPSSSSSTSKNTSLALHLNPTNPAEIYHVSLSPSSELATTSNGKNSGDPLQISLLRPSPGPTPQLSKPVAPRKAGGDGQGEEGEEEEKTLFQRYWWVFLLGAVLVLSAGGEGK